MQDKHDIDLHDVAAARAAFETNEPRDLFYRAATELVSLATAGKTRISVAEAVAVLLQTWNREYYRFHKFDARHFEAIENLFGANSEAINAFRGKKIEDSSSDDSSITSVFESFERILGPVGAAKSLHLLAPRFFPLWDRTIAAAYGLPLRKAGENADQYQAFMNIVSGQCKKLVEDGFTGNPLKAIDEYNYCKHTKGWI